jgi:hypothetical protein
LGSVHLEVLLVFGELRDSGPGALRGCAHDAEDAHQLVFIGCAGEERAAAVHFCHDAAGGPDVDAGVVGAGAEEDVWGAVPQRDDFVGEGVDGDAEGSGETEICELELAFVVDEEVLRLEIAVQDPVGVAEVNALQSWCMKDLMVIGGNAPRSPCVSMYFFRSLSMYSKTSMSLFSVWMTSCRLTMFSCFSSFINEISRIAVEGVPSSESRWISFNATSSPVCLFRPLKTWLSQHSPT